MLGGRIGVIVFGERVLPVYEEMVALYGLTDRIAGWRAVESAAPYGNGDQSEADALLIAAANDLVSRERAEVIVLAGAVMTGVPPRLQPSIPVPVLEGLACAVRQAELLVDLAPIKPQRGSYAALPSRELVEVDAAVRAMFPTAPESD
jgi:Asp/Glu/hydantoin racemase